MALLVSTQSLGNTELECSIDNETLAQVRSDYNGLILICIFGFFLIFSDIPLTLSDTFLYFLV